MSGSGIYRPRVAPLSAQIQEFTVKNDNGNNRKMWYVPPGVPLTPFLGPKNRYGGTQYDTPYGTSNGFRKSSSTGFDSARRIHRNDFGSRKSQTWYRALTYGNDTASKSTGKSKVNYFLPTRVFERHESRTGKGYEFHDVTPYNLVPRGASIVMPSEHLWHRVPSTENENRIMSVPGLPKVVRKENRQIRLTGTNIPRNQLMRAFGVYEANEAKNAANSNSNSQESANGKTPQSKKRKKRSKSPVPSIPPIPPMHIFRGIKRPKVNNYSARIGRWQRKKRTTINERGRLFQF